MSVWLLVTSGGKIVDKFRTKKNANQMKEYYLKNYGWGLEIKRKKLEVKNEQENKVSEM